MKNDNDSFKKIYIFPSTETNGYLANLESTVGFGATFHPAMKCSNGIFPVWYVNDETLARLLQMEEKEKIYFTVFKQDHPDQEPYPYNVKIPTAKNKKDSLYLHSISDDPLANLRIIYKTVNRWNKLKPAVNYWFDYLAMAELWMSKDEKLRTKGLSALIHRITHGNYHEIVVDGEIISETMGTLIIMALKVGVKVRPFQNNAVMRKKLPIYIGTIATK